MLKVLCWAALLLELILVAGCALGPAKKVADNRVPPDISRDDLLTVTAACHLLRVGQTTDVGATDVAVIAAVEQFDFSVEQVLDRSEELVSAFQSKERNLAEGAKVACGSLAEYTGVQPALVRFHKSGHVNTTWVRVSGEIDKGFADRTIARLRKSKAIGLVIDSRGGSVYEARKLGYYVRSNGLRVGVAGLCASACIDVLAGGVERYVTPTARLGIHQARCRSDTVVTRAASSTSPSRRCICARWALMTRLPWSRPRCRRTRCAGSACPMHSRRVWRRIWSGISEGGGLSLEAWLRPQGDRQIVGLERNQKTGKKISKMVRGFSEIA